MLRDAPQPTNIAVCEEGVILDSGVMDHICNRISLLSDICTVDVEVALSGDSIACSCQAGVMKMQANCTEKRRPCQFTLTDALHVPFFSTILWSVSAFNNAGHEVVFGLSTVRVVFNAASPNPSTIHLNRPFVHQDSHWPRTNAVFTHSLVHSNTACTAHAVASPAPAASQQEPAASQEEQGHCLVQADSSLSQH